ncbi:hypothetical protein V6N11_036815 [Hibiscus sabdariffa]|uniref:Pentatricopeptide repeat-containing protein n=1 Tax=Hibiscus sabdariffa TaxID=183260 RepID=A0ABR2RBK8_9ROSI
MEVDKGRELMTEMARRKYNAATYTVLIEYLGNIGKYDEVEKLVDEMRERRVDLYTWMIHWHCGRGSNKKVISLFNELSEKGLVPNAHVYGALINGLCKTGQMEAAQLLRNDMQRQGIVVNQVIVNTPLHGYCRKGMMDDALRLVAAMEKKGFEPDAFTYNIMASETSRLKRHEEAKRWLHMMVDEAVKLFNAMSRKGLVPNVATYTAIISGLSTKGRSDEALRLYNEMISLEASV